VGVNVSWHMNSSRSTRDSRGNMVSLGDRVRVVSLDPKFLASLPSEEVDDVRSMVGESFEVESIDEQGSAWVTKWWRRREGESRSHSVGLAPPEMERLERENAN